MIEALTIETSESAGRVVVTLAGPLDRETVPRVFGEALPLLERKTPLTFDMGGVSRMDSAGLALLTFCARRLGSGPTGFALRRVGGEVAKTLALAGGDHAAGVEPVAFDRSGFAESLGGEADTFARAVQYYLYLLSETFFHGVVSPWKGLRPRLRIFVEQLALLGAGSAPIVWLVALLVGLTTAYQAAYQLRQFGANIYIADLVSISMMTELGPLMAAILVAGRSGAAITAEISTMQVNEEIDALRLIGVQPIQYLVVPRVYAVVITQALLGVTSAIVGIFGGFAVAVAMLDLSPVAFLDRAVHSLVLVDLLNNVIKSAIFGFIIVTIGAFFGLRVSGGAEGVGRATTSSVVTSIFLIIVADCVYSLI